MHDEGCFEASVVGGERGQDSASLVSEAVVDLGSDPRSQRCAVDLGGHERVHGWETGRPPVGPSGGHPQPGLVEEGADLAEVSAGEVRAQQ